MAQEGSPQVAEAGPRPNAVPRGLQRMIGRAIGGLEQNKASLLEAGVSDDQFTVAVGNARGRAQREYEALAAQDPFARVGAILDGVASTDTERAIARHARKIMETHRNWVREKLGSDRKSDLRLVADGTGFGILGWVENSAIGKPGIGSIVTPVAFQERLLKGLGSLENGQTIEDLIKYTEKKPGPNGEYYDLSLGHGQTLVRNLPTDIEGMQALVYVRGPMQGVHLWVDRPTTEKIAAFEP